MLIASGLFGLFDSLIKYLADFFTSGEIAFFRFGFGFLVMFPFLLHQRPRLDRQGISLLILRGLLAVGTFYVAILAFRASTLSVTMVLIFTNPAWTLLLGASFLNERLTWRRSAGVMVALAGMAILVNPWKGHVSLGHLYGLLAGVMVGIDNVLLRYLRIRHDARVIYAFFCLVGILSSIPSISSNLRVPGLNKGILLVACGALGLLAQVTMIYGFRFIRAAEGATLIMTEAILTAVIGILLFRDPLTVRFVVGAALVVTSGIYLGLHGGREGTADCTQKKRQDPQAFVQ